MRVCIIYDCLFPWTYGGAERWYRNLAERLAADGHEVSYLTRLQWPSDEPPDLPGVRVIAVSREESLYGDDGNRRIGQALRFGGGVLRHLLRHGRDYDVVHTASFPYFSLLAAALVRPYARYGLVVDWHEVWSRAYWRSYLGTAKGAVGYAVQRLCVRRRQHAFCFSRMHADRLRQEGLRSEPTQLEGEYLGDLTPPQPNAPGPTAVFVGRHIAEKRATAVVAAIAQARRRLPELRGAIFGDGPERAAVLAEIEAHGLDGIVEAPGFVDQERIDTALREALCLVHPSSREGYGLVVVEASARAVPAIVVAGEDNASTELIEDGANGFVATSADPEVLADAIVRVWDAGTALRERTADWFTANATRLSMASSLERVLDAYRAGVITRR